MGSRHHMTPDNKRKVRRCRMSYRGRILDGGAPRACILRDVSATGARIQVMTAAELPVEFVLALSAQGRPRRKCRVIWRNDKEVGVRFQKDTDQPP